MFLLGHSFEYIDGMNLRDFGDVIGFWSGEAKARDKLNKKSQGGSNRGRSGRGRRR